MWQIVSRWPVVLLIALVAVAAALVASLSRDASYSAKVELLVTPLAQYDETFLGTSLVRDAGDAARTASTVAATLDSRAVDAETAARFGEGWSADRVADHVDVGALDDANVVEVSGRASDRATAARLATTFAEAALDVRWEVISTELGQRIAVLDDLADATGGEPALLRDRELLAATRRSGHDPTLRLQDVEPRVSEEGLGTPLLVVLALIGGLVLGALAALLASSAVRRPGDGAVAPTDP